MTECAVRNCCHEDDNIMYIYSTIILYDKRNSLCTWNYMDLQNYEYRQAMTNTENGNILKNP